MMPRLGRSEVESSCGTKVVTGEIGVIRQDFGVPWSPISAVAELGFLKGAT